MRKNFFSDLSCTHGRTCVYERYAPASDPKIIGIKTYLCENFSQKKAPENSR